MIYSYVISKSIRPVKINPYDITMVILYDITMGNNIARYVHCDITMINDVAICTHHGITMHNKVAMNIFYYVFSVLCLIVLLYYG